MALVDPMEVEALVTWAAASAAMRAPASEATTQAVAPAAEAAFPAASAKVSAVATLKRTTEAAWGTARTSTAVAEAAFPAAPAKVSAVASKRTTAAAWGPQEPRWPRRKHLVRFPRRSRKRLPRPHQQRFRQC